MTVMNYHLSTIISSFDKGKNLPEELSGKLGGK